MIKFVVGKKYMMRSVCDDDCIWVYTVLSRTASTITIKNDNGETQRCRIGKSSSEYFGSETVRPLGKFSMSPYLTADKLCK